MHSIGLSPDGARLLALYRPDGRLSVFDITNPANSRPVLVAEIPAGLEPVSRRARTRDEVRVVNEVSDSVSVVSDSGALQAGAARATIGPSRQLLDPIAGVTAPFYRLRRTR